MRDAMQIRSLSRDEIEQIWSIDRSELTETIYRLESGRIVEAWAEWDNLAGLKQLGHSAA